jgi:Alpha-N-acetylglucosaminidase (NAGLU) tim-barrel domain/Alpha-N-acetylglucosaminidase (NAGLU) C-terminal domain/Alpha-N-acetylglucosaminidase (NAGLU) N-terminal domain/NPCBM-associated, NEW3 domain of alpha-galactosidase
MRIVVALAAALALAAPAPAAAFDVSSARGAIERLAPRYADQVELRALPPSGGRDRFEIAGEDGHIVLSGTSPVALTSAFDWYLRHEAGGQLSWSADQLDLGRELPAPDRPTRHASPYRHRYIYNFTEFGYTSPYWDWDRWQREIDLLAAKGINLALVTVGQEAVWYDTFREFGYSDEEIRQWIVLPAHQPWQWMSNMSSFGGPISAGLIERRAELGRRIVERMRALGITPVLPGFSGTVPAGFAERNPGANVVPQGDWVGFDRPDWLDPSTDTYERVAASFYGHQEERFGLTGAYAVDILHEGGNAGGVDVAAAARGIERAMGAADPDSTWVIQAWQSNPRRELVEAVDKSRLLVLDINGDNDPRWPDTEAFWGARWAWGVLQNAGGRTGLYGNLQEMAHTLPGVLASPERGNLDALAIAMEGTGHNAVVLDLIADMAWRIEPVDLDDWIAEYVHWRYGASDPDALAAWRVLRETAYGTTADEVAGVMGSAESLFAARPSLNATKVSTWGPNEIRYDPDELREAWRYLLRAGPRLQRVDTFRYDLVDLTRQVLANESHALLPEIRTAYTDHDRRAFATLTGRFLRLMELSEQVLRTRREFLLGPWLARARAWGATEAERDQLEWDARTILTVWGHRRAADAGGLHDYANREWAGLMSDFYRARWAAYFAALEEALAEREPPEEIDWFAWEDGWTRRQNAFPVTPQGDPYGVARAVAREAQGSVVAALTDAKNLALGQEFTVTTRFTNWTTRTASDVELLLVAPWRWRVEAQGPVTFDRVRSMEAVETSWRVTVPENADWRDYQLIARAAHRGGHFKDVRGVTVEPTPSAVEPPYKTFSTTAEPAQYAQSGERFAIWAGGRDVSGWVDEKAMIYREDAASADSTIEVKVASQHGSGPVAKAGIAVANDLTAPERGGYAILHMTSQYGLEFMWDGDGDGRLDGWAGGGASFHPAWLRLVRRGGVYTAFSSPDGQSWQQVGTASVESADGVGDAGMFTGAVNLNYPGQITRAVFEEFAVTEAATSSHTAR